MSLGIEKKAFRSVNPEDFVFCVIFLDQKKPVDHQVIEWRNVASLQRNMVLDNHKNNLYANTHTNHISKTFLHTNKIYWKALRAKGTGSLL